MIVMMLARQVNQRKEKMKITKMRKMSKMSRKAISSSSLSPLRLKSLINSPRMTTMMKKMMKKVMKMTMMIKCRQSMDLKIQDELHKGISQTNNLVNIIADP